MQLKVKIACAAVLFGTTGAFAAGGVYSGVTCDVSALTGDVAEVGGIVGVRVAKHTSFGGAVARAIRIGVNLI